MQHAIVHRPNPDVILAAGRAIVADPRVQAIAVVVAGPAAVGAADHERGVGVRGDRECQRQGAGAVVDAQVRRAGDEAVAVAGGDAGRVERAARADVDVARVVREAGGERERAEGGGGGDVLGDGRTGGGGEQDSGGEQACWRHGGSPLMLGFGVEN